jgi:hypothetical protein
MKKYAVSILLFPLIFSCNTKQADKDHLSVDTIKSIVSTDTTSVYKDTHYFWSSDFDPKKGMMMIRSRPIPADSLTAGNIIQTLNQMYPEIKLSVTKVSNDSIFIKIKNSKYLTNQSGSSGAEAYLAEVTYNLTELKGINFVYFNFKEGNHAAPGTYSRTDFLH